MQVITIIKIVLVLTAMKSVEARRRRARFGRPSARRTMNIDQNDATDDIDRCRISCQSRPLQKLALLNSQ